MPFTHIIALIIAYMEGLISGQRSGVLKGYFSNRVFCGGRISDIGLFFSKASSFVPSLTNPGINGKLSWGKAEKLALLV